MSASVNSVCKKYQRSLLHRASSSWDMSNNILRTVQSLLSITFIYLSYSKWFFFLQNLYIWSSTLLCPLPCSFNLLVFLLKLSVTASQFCHFASAQCISFTVITFLMLLPHLSWGVCGVFDPKIFLIILIFHRRRFSYDFCS